MKNAFLVTGMPGAGKTTYLSRQVRKAAEKYGSESILIASLTKTAAAEIAGRDLPLEDRQCSTLHSHAYRTLGKAVVAQSPKAIKEWNAWLAPKGLASIYSLSPDGSSDLDNMTEEHTGKEPGDEIFEAYNLLRNKMRPRDVWSKSVLAFAALWEEWKERSGSIDFTDMIELALRKDYCNIPQIGIFDEVQDFSALELALVKKWAEQMEFVVLAGDSDQTLFCFRGADAKNIYALPIEEQNKKFLLQSFRCPRAVVKYANAVINECSQRERIFMLPKDADGELRKCSASFYEPEEAIFDAEDYLRKGKTVAFLATAGYMLNNLIAVLRREGTPFENRFRRANGKWNPLHGGRGISAKDRILAFIDGCNGWSNEDVYNWSKELDAKKTMTRGAKTEIEKAIKEAFDLSKLRDWFAPCWPEPLKFDPMWLYRNILASDQRKYDFPLTVMQKHGTEALMQSPQITIGTIHSVKGATFDVVYLFPDISPSAYEEIEAGDEGRDSALRTWYVGASRAAESLIICYPATKFITPFEE